MDNQIVFKLEPDNRNCSDEELLDDLKKIAQMLNTKKLSITDYAKYGRFSYQTITKRFNSWSIACEKVGLFSARTECTDEELLNELKRVNELAILENVSLTKDFFNIHKNIGNTGTIQQRFGSWTNALKKAEISLTRIQKRYTENELMENIFNIWTFLGKQPTSTSFSETPSVISFHAYQIRYGTIRKALERFIEYINQDSKEESETKVTEEIITENSGIIKHKTSRNINLHLRWIVLQRDSFKCVACGKSPANTLGVELQVDHIIPWAKGGETVLENLQTLCSTCNLGKSDYT